MVPKTEFIYFSTTGGIVITLINFLELLSPDLRAIFLSLSHPSQIQNYLDDLPYIAEELDRSPLRVMTDHQAHCLDGGIFAALALSQLGHPPLIMDLVPEPGLDDDHVLAIYQVNGYWGCVAKSNYPVLRSREPAYRTLRELAMSYFDFYFNIRKLRSLRGYTRPLLLSRYPVNWMWDESGIALISKDLYSKKPIPLLPASMIPKISIGDDITYKTASMGTNFDWVFGMRQDH
jgi:hypothetical protein